MASKDEKPNRREMLTALGGAAVAAAVVVSATGTAQAQAATLSFVVDRYKAYYYSAPQYGWEARIYLYSTGLDQSCVLYFMKDGETIPANTVAASGNSANVYFGSNRLADIREFLRNERPVRIGVMGSNGIATLSNDEYEFVGDSDA